jgi:transcriptional regulator with GAF, ATPase, and Fis domain
VVGQSAPWRDVFKKATQVAATETTTLLQGESGTGKELVARWIHRHSPRKAGPFVALNCAALPETLLESELFGYERGAFTGAQIAKPGQIELAAGGVLFLDEVSEMSPSAQAKFLRVLQEREFQRLGGTRPLKANVRVIAATNRDLREAVEEGAFREDLFYRLAVFDILLPPLRERRGDIPLLASAFLEDIGRSLGRPPATLTRDATDLLVTHDWPGNVRELRNALERAAILCGPGLIAREHLLLHPRRAAPSVTDDLKSIERGRIEQVLRETDGNKSRTASRLGLTRSQLYVRLRKYDLEGPAVA